MGPTNFLQILTEKLLVIAEGEYNQRIAPYGMGGVGKIQCAFGYVYEYRHEYQWVYWVSAANRSLISSGYEGIALEESLASPDEAPEKSATDRPGTAWATEELAPCD